MTEQHSDPIDAARRRFLRRAAMLVGAGASAGLPARAASAKVSHQLAGYQTTPNGQARCQVCSQFLPAPACKVVEDPIVPTGWCKLYAAKAG
jgi:hypothetical protein